MASIRSYKLLKADDPATVGDQYGVIVEYGTFTTDGSGDATVTYDGTDTENSFGNVLHFDILTPTGKTEPGKVDDATNTKITISSGSNSTIYKYKIEGTTA